MSPDRKSHLPLKIAIRALLNIALVWILAGTLDEYLVIEGGWKAFIVIGALLTLLNLFVRPVLQLLSIPLRLVATLIAIMIVNGIFLWLVTLVTSRMDPSIVLFEIRGGIGGWIVLALILGFANWLQKLILR